MPDDAPLSPEACAEIAARWARAELEGWSGRSVWAAADVARLLSTVASLRAALDQATRERDALHARLYPEKQGTCAHAPDGICVSNAMGGDPHCNWCGKPLSEWRAAPPEGDGTG